MLLLARLGEEESAGIPLMRKHFTHAEIRPVSARALALPISSLSTTVRAGHSMVLSMRTTLHYLHYRCTIALFAQVYKCMQWKGK